MATTKPKPINEKHFEHDCSKCEFIGHFQGHDVYLCGDIKEKFGCSIVGRYGDEGPQYSSVPLTLFKRLLDENDLVEVRGGGRGFDYATNFHKMILKDVDYYQAFVLALAKIAMKDVPA